MCREKDLSLPLMTPFPAPPTCARSTPWLPLATDVGWVSAPCLTLTGTTGASLCSRCGSRASTFLPPVPRRSFALCASRGSSPLRYHEGSDSCTAHLPCRSPRLPRHTFLSFRLQPRGLPEHRLPPRQRVQRFSDFALESQARRSSSAESSSLYYGPTFRLRLLSTSLHSDAVTFDFGVCGILRHGLSPC